MRRTLRFGCALVALAAAAAMAPSNAGAAGCTYRDCMNQLDECVWDFGIAPEKCVTTYDVCVGMCASR